MSKLYEPCPLCKGNGKVPPETRLCVDPPELAVKILAGACPPCKGSGFVETGLTTGQVDRLREEARRWYLPGGTYELLDSPEAVVERRKVAAAELERLRTDLATERKHRARERALGGHCRSQWQNAMAAYLIERHGYTAEKAHAIAESRIAPAVRAFLDSYAREAEAAAGASVISGVSGSGGDNTGANTGEG